MHASTVSISSWSMRRRASSSAASVARDTLAAAGSECLSGSRRGIRRLSAAQAGSRTKPESVRTGTRTPRGGAAPRIGGLWFRRPYVLPFSLRGPVRTTRKPPPELTEQPWEV
jgi:hypothetical protein